MNSRPAPNASTLRKLAVEAEVDPRTLMRVWKGGQVATMSSKRAAKALEAAGLLPNGAGSEDSK